MSFSFWRGFLYSQFFVTPPYPTKDHTGETIIITGSNTGLGQEAARHFVRLNAKKVIIAVRSLSKGEAAADSIHESTGRKGVCEVWPLDLSNYQSVKEFTARVNELDRLDAIIENAGVSTSEFRLVEGLEQTITVNVVGTFLLALGVLPKLREVAKTYNITPHLSIISSEVQFFTDMPERKGVRDGENLLDALSDKSRAIMRERYPVSKLLEVYFTRELAARTAPSPVIINFVNPGFCHSELARETPILMGLMKMVLARTTEHGSRALVNCVDEDVVGRAGGCGQGGEKGGKMLAMGSHGGYLSDCMVAPCAPHVESEEGREVQKMVWRDVGRKLEEIQPGIMGNV